jgi:hypothetical protein
MLLRAVKQSQLINSSMESLIGTNNLEVLGSFNCISILVWVLEYCLFRVRRPQELFGTVLLDLGFGFSIVGSANIKDSREEPWRSIC